MGMGSLNDLLKKGMKEMINKKEPVHHKVRRGATLPEKMTIINDWFIQIATNQHALDAK